MVIHFLLPLNDSKLPDLIFYFFFRYTIKRVLQYYLKKLKSSSSFYTLTRSANTNKKLPRIYDRGTHLFLFHRHRRLFRRGYLHLPLWGELSLLRWFFRLVQCRLAH